jgi:tetratricopeptide (TPR) repeat protein
MLSRFTGLAWLAVLACALYWTVRLQRADWLFVKGDAASIREAIRLAPGNVEYASALAEAEPARAVEILKSAAAQNPLDGGLRVQLGLAEEKRGDFVHAEADLLEAGRLDRGFAPRWALGDFYFHRQDAKKFWPVVREALNVSYGDVSAQFRQGWGLTRDADFILQRAIPDRPAVLRQYLNFLVSEGRLDAAVPVAGRVLAKADRDAAPSLVNYCDRMLADWRGEDALAIWNGLVERKLIAESGHGFDWRIAEAPEIHVERAADGWMLRFSGRQPESAEILSRYVPLVPGRRYRVSGTPAESGLQCRLLVADGRDLLSLPQPLANARGSVTLGRLVLAYRRVPGTTRIEGSVAVGDLAVKAAER